MWLLPLLNIKFYLRRMDNWNYHYTTIPLHQLLLASPNLHIFWSLSGHSAVGLDNTITSITISRSLLPVVPKHNIPLHSFVPRTGSCWVSDSFKLAHLRGLQACFLLSPSHLHLLGISSNLTWGLHTHLISKLISAHLVGLRAKMCPCSIPGGHCQPNHINVSSPETLLYGQS